VVIGIAEPANIPGVGAVANAVFNACGVRVRDLPITPDKILDGLAKRATT
jgi:xanthine dehydrogenase YagR molybdenum-binding subunit